MHLESICAYLLALLAAPLLIGVINRVKALFAGRHGQPLLQVYYDLAKLARKDFVYSRTTTWLFRAAPMAGLVAILLALAFVPLGGIPALLAFNGDFLLIAYLLGLTRFLTMLAALDTGSAFEGMGASREAWIAALAEPVLLLGLAAVARVTGAYSLTAALGAVSAALWAHAGNAMALVLLAWLVVVLAENARIPVDDPNTHLELTMIHEVMVLDHGGPDLALILYGAALKMWLLGAWLVGLVVPARTGWFCADLGIGLAGMLALAVVVGVLESVMARLRLTRVPYLLAAAGAFVVLALFMAAKYE